MRHPDDVTIVSATPDDAEVVADIVRSAYSNVPDTQTPADMPIYHADYHAEALADPSARWRLLCDREGPAGVAMWRLLPGLGHLHLLFVAAHKQGHGYGSLLLRHFQDCAVEEQPATRLLTLHCLAGSARTMRFYRRHGYTQYEQGMEGRIPDLYLWVDASRRQDTAWPLRKEMLLFFKLVR